MKNYQGEKLESVVTRFRYHRRPKRVVANCPVCGSADQSPVHDHDRYGFPQPSVLCMNCGLVYLTPLLTPKTYGRFYRSFYRALISAYWRQPWGPRRLQRDQIKYSAPLLTYLRGHLPRKPEVIRVLDIGGSVGIIANAVVELCKAAGGNAAGTVIDPSRIELAEAEKRGLKTVCGQMETAQLPEKNYEVILLCRTIDHLMDPKAVLTRAREVLTPGGLLFVDFVDFAWVSRRRGLRRALQVDHICNFSAPVFWPMMRQIGFEPIAPIKEYGPERGKLFKKAAPFDLPYKPSYALELKQCLEMLRAKAR